MLYDLTADLLILIHFGFILFAILGALLVVRWPRLAWLHLPAALWAFGIITYGGICPLTPLENHFRILAGGHAYHDSFIGHYIGSLVYPAGITPLLRLIFGGGVLAINLILYTWLIKRRRH